MDVHVNVETKGFITVYLPIGYPIGGNMILAYCMGFPYYPFIYVLWLFIVI